MIVAASMGAELTGLRREAEEFQESKDTVLPVEFHLLGVGPDRSGASLTELLNKREPGKKTDGVLLLGVAGAVTPGLDTGSLLLASGYAVDVPGSSSGAVVLEPDAKMRTMAEQAAAELGMPANLGASLTVDHLVGGPEEKQELREKYTVDSVNMEDYRVAEAAAKAEVPFLSVRVVLDTAWQRLPDYLPGLTRSRYSVLTKVLGMPWRIPTLWQLKNQLLLCQTVITRFGMTYLNLETNRLLQWKAQVTERTLY